MTAQFSDTVHYREKPYDLAGTSGGSLFEPGPHGLFAQGTCTACWRGFLCEYAVVEKRLVLQTLNININPDFEGGAAPTLNGVGASRPQEKFALFTHIYPDVGLTIPFTGGLLLATDFIQDLYVHMGYHPAWKYREVMELSFHEGTLERANDVSVKMEEIRAQQGPGGAGSGADTLGAKVLALIRSAFDWDY